MTRGKGTLRSALILAGAAVVLSACAADPGYDSTAFEGGYPVYGPAPYGYPAYGYFGFDDWAGDWHHRDHWHGSHR